MEKITFYSLILFIVAFFNQPTSNSKFDEIFLGREEYIVDGFDFPVGKPNAKGYYNAQKFTENYHLGKD